MSHVITLHTKTVAITRPQEDAAAMAAELTSRGVKAFIVPMLRIELVEERAALLQQAMQQKLQAICVTSKHAVHALAGQKQVHGIALYAVGEATAQAAKEAGFTKIFTADGTVASLLLQVVESCRPDAGAVLYARGQDITLDLALELKSHGLPATEATLYRAVLVDRFPQEYVQALKSGQVDEVLFFSPRSAANYCSIAVRDKLIREHHAITAICTSESVTGGLSNLPWKRVVS